MTLTDATNWWRRIPSENLVPGRREGIDSLSQRMSFGEGLLGINPQE
jgi:hypothetical protein